MERMEIKLDVWLYRITLVLIALVLLSTWMLSGLSARFTTSAYADESARVAKFSVSDSVQWISTQELTADIQPGQSKVANIKVTNNSEVAVGYNIKVTNNSNNLPLSFYVNDNPIGADGYTVHTAANAGDDQIIQLNIVWDAGNAEANLEYMGMVDYITVTITASQID